MPKAKVIKSKTTSIVDTETGEVHMVETEKLVSVKTETEEFFQIYCRLIASVYELKYADDIKILIKFCEIAQFNTGVVLLPAALRKKVCEEIGILTSNMSKSIKRLKDKELLTGDRGEYKINPAIFWKGEQKVRAQILKDNGLALTLNFKSE